jgi:hypothetical protein
VSWASRGQRATIAGSSVTSKFRRCDDRVRHCDGASQFDTLLSMRFARDTAMSCLSPDEQPLRRACRFTQPTSSLLRRRPLHSLHTRHARLPARLHCLLRMDAIAGTWKAHRRREMGRAHCTSNLCRQVKRHEAR